MNEPATFACDTAAPGHPDRLEAYREGACAALVVHEGKKAAQVNLPEHEAHRLVLWLAQHLCEVRQAAVDAPVNAPLPAQASDWDPSRVNYRRVDHAAHYGSTAEAGGHDLEQWTYAQPERLPAPEGIPADATYLHGSRRDGVQFWTYQRTAPWLQLYCDRCRPRVCSQCLAPEPDCCGGHRENVGGHHPLCEAAFVELPSGARLCSSCRLGLPRCSRCLCEEFPERVRQFGGLMFCAGTCLEDYVRDTQAIAAYRETRPGSAHEDICHRSEPCCQQGGQRHRKAAQACPEDCSCHD